MPTKTNDRKGEGFKLFARMLRAVYRDWKKPIPDSVPDSKLDDIWRKADTSTLLRYLERVETSPPKVREGFYLAMTEFLGSAPEVTIRPEFFEKAAEKHRNYAKAHAQQATH